MNEQQIWPPSPNNQPLPEVILPESRSKRVIGIASISCAAVAIVLTASVHWLAYQPGAGFTGLPDPLWFRVRKELSFFGNILYPSYLLGVTGIALGLSAKTVRFGKIGVCIAFAYLATEIILKITLCLLFPLPPPSVAIQ